LHAPTTTDEKQATLSLTPITSSLLGQFTDNTPLESTQDTPHQLEQQTRAKVGVVTAEFVAPVVTDSTIPQESTHKLSTQETRRQEVASIVSDTHHHHSSTTDKPTLLENTSPLGTTPGDERDRAQERLEIGGAQSRAVGVEQTTSLDTSQPDGSNYANVRIVATRAVSEASHVHTLSSVGQLETDTAGGPEHVTATSAFTEPLATAHPTETTTELHTNQIRAQGKVTLASDTMKTADVREVTLLEGPEKEQRGELVRAAVVANAVQIVEIEEEQDDKREKQMKKKLLVQQRQETIEEVEGVVVVEEEESESEVTLKRKTSSGIVSETETRYIVHPKTNQQHTETITTFKSVQGSTRSDQQGSNYISQPHMFHTTTLSQV